VAGDQAHAVDEAEVAVDEGLPGDIIALVVTASEQQSCRHEDPPLSPCYCSVTGLQEGDEHRDVSFLADRTGLAIEAARQLVLAHYLEACGCRLLCHSC
jgi:hypothetical protein